MKKSLKEDIKIAYGLCAAAISAYHQAEGRLRIDEQKPHPFFEINNHLQRLEGALEQIWKDDKELIDEFKKIKQVEEARLNEFLKELD